MTLSIQRGPGGKVNILGGHSISHSKQRILCVLYVLFRKLSEIELFHCTVLWDALRRTTHHVLTRVAKCIGVDGGILENILY
jgi:hypothetical protein